MIGLIFSLIGIAGLGVIVWLAVSWGKSQEKVEHEVGKSRSVSKANAARNRLASDPDYRDKLYKKYKR